jgi:hypothetical protein
MRDIKPVCWQLQDRRGFVQTWEHKSEGRSRWFTSDSKRSSGETGRSVYRSYFKGTSSTVSGLTLSRLWNWVWSIFPDRNIVNRHASRNGKPNAPLINDLLSCRTVFPSVRHREQELLVWTLSSFKKSESTLDSTSGESGKWDGQNAQNFLCDLANRNGIQEISRQWNRHIISLTRSARTSRSTDRDFTSEAFYRSQSIQMSWHIRQAAASKWTIPSRKPFLRAGE